MITSHRLICSTILLTISTISIRAAGADAPAEKPIKLMKKLGDWHHPVTTKNKQAQHFFDQGLTLIYGFNHDAAIRSFKKALELDPDLGMAHWGIAYALGPNINLDVDPEREKAAFNEAQTALQMSVNLPAEERDYILALTNRYSADPKADLKTLQVNFKNAMREVAKKYPDDLDAATLYAESMMNLHPWALWSPDGKPAEDTEEIVAVLESVIRRDPNHPGANHYYIHAVEASPTPDRALVSAQRLEKLVPAAGHLVHMPAHIYMRTGDYENAARRNEVAAAADRDYIASCGVKGIYPLMYYSHNLHFLAVAEALQGRFDEAKKAADKLVANVAGSVKDIPELEGFLPTPYFILAVFQRWEEVLKLPAPDPALKGTQAAWHFTRGMALAATGKADMAEKELGELQRITKSIPPEAMFSPLNKAQDVLKVANLQLEAKIACAKNDMKLAIDRLEKSTEAEDALHYDEPPDWYLYSREALGAVLLKQKDYARAESVFREDLRRNPRKGRALLGLRASLAGQGKKASAAFVSHGFETAWKNADGPAMDPAVW